MEFETFVRIYEAAKQEDSVFSCLALDAIPREEEIVAFEEAHRIRLPEKYKQLLRSYGGGYIGYSIVFSLDPTGDYSLEEENRFQEPLGPGRYLYVSNNGCGDLYGCRIDEEGRCGERIFFYDHEIDEVSETEWADLLEFLVWEIRRVMK